METYIVRMNYSELMSQALSAPPYIFAFIVVISTAILSDRHHNRSYYICFQALLGASGYMIIAIAGYLRAHSLWRYAGVYFAAAGFFGAVTLIITWTINNQPSASRRGTGVVMLNVLGQMGPLIGTRLYPDSDKPFYVRGMSICAGFMFLVFILAIALRAVLVRQNRKTEEAQEYQHIIGEEDEVDGMVDKNTELASHRPFLNIL